MRILISYLENMLSQRSDNTEGYDEEIDDIPESIFDDDLTDFLS